MNTASRAAQHTPLPRTALVTGASGGIGRSVALRLAADGFAIAAHYGGNRSGAEEVAQSIRELGATAMTVPGDIADEEDMMAAFDAVETTLGSLDVLVHTAGIMTLGPLADFSLAAFDRMHRTNVRGTAVVDQLAARRLNSGGAIINFSSSVTKLAFPGYAPYAATKGAVDAMTLILARELRGRDITVNAVAPGPTATELFLADKDPETIARISSVSPLERLGQPEDIAELVALLAGPGRWINGQVLYANGGAI